MKITADTNLLVRAAVHDHPAESLIAAATLDTAELVAVTLPTLCEFAWVLDRVYRRGRGEIAAAIRQLIAAGGVEADRSAIQAGLDLLEAGGDFADGVIAYEGRRLGGDIFATFDRQAAALLERGGKRVLHLRGPD